MNRLILLILFLFSSFSYSADYPYDCSYKIYEEYFVYIAIPDEQIPNFNKEPIWRNPDLKNGECLVSYVDHKNNTYGLYNEKGYSYSKWIESGFNSSDWASVYDENGVGYGGYTVSCDQVNSGIPSIFKDRYEFSTKVFVDTLYIRDCYDKNGKYGNTTGICYSEVKEYREVTVNKTCYTYICETSDFGYEGVYYSCPVRCVDLDRPARYTFISGFYSAYICKYVPEIDDKEDDEFCFTCLIDQFTNSVLDTIDTIDIQLQFIFDRFLNDKAPDSEVPEVPDSEVPEVPDSEVPQPLDILLPVENTDFSVSQFVKNLFPTSALCPKDSDLNILSTNISFSYLRICDALSYLSTLLMILSIYASYRIIRSA